MHMLFDMETQNLVLSEQTLAMVFQLIQQQNFMSIFFVFFTRKAPNANFGCIDS